MGPRIKSVYVKLHFRTYIVGTWSGTNAHTNNAIFQVAIVTEKEEDSAFKGDYKEYQLYI